MRLRVEFTTEPFAGEGELPAHVTRPATVLTDAGIDVDLGPFGTAAEGPQEQLLSLLGATLAEALAAGATRVTLMMERVESADQQHGQPEQQGRPE